LTARTPWSERASTDVLEVSLPKGLLHIALDIFVAYLHRRLFRSYHHLQVVHDAFYAGYLAGILGVARPQENEPLHPR
jgi:hypothetical protein